MTTPRQRESRRAFLSRFMASPAGRSLSPKDRAVRAHELYEKARTPSTADGVADSVVGIAQKGGGACKSGSACACGGSCKDCTASAGAREAGPSREQAPTRKAASRPSGSSGLDMSRRFRAVMEQHARGELTAAGKTVKDRGAALKLAMAAAKAARTGRRLMAAGSATGTTRKSLVSEGDAHAGGLQAQVEDAARKTDVAPTEPQKKSGRYRKGKVLVQGLPIVIENPRGSYRSGVDPSGKPWRVRMAHHYGYVARTESDADGDPVDVFLGPQPHLDTVWVIDQVKADGRTFDEHKCMIGFPGELAARQGYLDNYKLGWRGLGAITPLSMAEFKEWLKGDTSRPLAPRLRIGQPWALGLTEKSGLGAGGASGAASAGPAPAAAMSSVVQSRGGALRAFPALAASREAAARKTRKRIVRLSSGDYRLFAPTKDPQSGKPRVLGTFKSYHAALNHERAARYFKQACGVEGVEGAVGRRGLTRRDCEGEKSKPRIEAKPAPAVTRKSATATPSPDSTLAVAARPRPPARPHPCSACCPCARCRGAVCVVAYPLAALTCKDAGGGPGGTALAERQGLVHVNRRRDVKVDDDRRSASGILATSSRDRQGDVIECRGVDFSDHRANPIVLWDHGKMTSVPIGKCEDEEERYTVRYLPEPDVIVQGTHFANTPFADQIYALVRDGFIRANSIAVKDLEVEPLPPDPSRGHFVRRDAEGRKIPFKHILKSALAEVTWTSLPANPEAVRSLLAGGRIDTGGYGRVEIDGIVRKSLEGHLPARRAQVTSGFAPAAANGLTLKSRWA